MEEQKSQGDPVDESDAYFERQAFEFQNKPKLVRSVRYINIREPYTVQQNHSR